MSLYDVINMYITISLTAIYTMLSILVLVKYWRYLDKSAKLTICFFMAAFVLESTNDEVFMEMNTAQSV